jgi:hypothetical protein
MNLQDLSLRFEELHEMKNSNSPSIQDPHVLEVFGFKVIHIGLSAFVGSKGTRPANAHPKYCTGE